MIEIFKFFSNDWRSSSLFIVQIAFIETLAKAPLYVFLLITFLFLRLSKGKFYEIKHKCDICNNHSL